VEPPLLGEPVFVVKPKTSRHSNARFIPENCTLHGFDVQLHRVEDVGIYGSTLFQYRNDPERAALVREPTDVIGAPTFEYVEDQVVAGFTALAETAIPIVGFNLFNYGWRAVAADGLRRMRREDLATPPYDFAEVIPRTIDVQDAIVQVAMQARRDNDSLPPVKHGAFALETLLEHNDVRLVAQNEASPADAVGALWYFMVAGKEVSVDGHLHEIPDEVMAHLTASRSRYDDAIAWAAQIRETGWTRDYYVRNYKQVESQLHDVYGAYLTALSER